MNEYQCTKCKKYFEPEKQSIKIKVFRKIIQCPYCNKKYEILTFSNQYIRLKNGQLINRFKKVKMSKKERLKLRRNEKN